MKATSSNKRQAGYVSFLMVLSTGAILSLLTIYAYRSAMAAHAVTSQVQLRVDYSEKEETILRSIVAITPNRAIRAMQSDSDLTGTRESLSWETIFTESLVLANAGTSISSAVQTTLESSLSIANLTRGNSGDSALTSVGSIFAAIPPDRGYISSGINRSIIGYPRPLTSTDVTTTSRDVIYPIISDHKYDALATGGSGPLFENRQKFNLLQYPKINFGYARPGDDFVAKRNWWTFSVDVGGNDSLTTKLATSKRNFVLSIYEIPSQLSISASSFMSLGQYASGSAWQNVTIDGGVFAGRSEVLGNTPLASLASRRSMTLSPNAKIGGAKALSEKDLDRPFAPGGREDYQKTDETFFPVSLASESGRSAFISINRGAEFFDRFSQTEESDTLSTTSWNNYSIGALQCAMQLDITDVVSATDMTPTMLRFTCLQTDGTRISLPIPLTQNETLPAGYVRVCGENESHTFNSPVDLAYGVSGDFKFRQGLSGPITFNSDNFGDPKSGVTASRAGYWRPQGPWKVETLNNKQKCITVYPERIPALLAVMGAAGPAVNNSLVVNVDYSLTGLNNPRKYKPVIPCRFDDRLPGDADHSDYGAILRECKDLSQFTKGFSLVTNLRLYIADDFNYVAIPAPSGYTPPVTAANPSGSYFPPCSLFSPEKRYGVDENTLFVDLRGQVGSLASDAVTTAVRPLDSKNVNGTAFNPSQITINLSPIKHPTQLPPITMMNWLVVLEELRREFVNY
ncbi:MAG: hypothetical protein RLZZ398_163 [Verrucomicrobiota bacterium]|jgi:hypothetical protein